MPVILDHDWASKIHNHIVELVCTWFEEMDSPSLKIDYDVILNYIIAIRYPSDELWSDILETRIGYAPQGLLSALFYGKGESTQDSECMSVLFSLLISGFRPPKDQRRSIKGILFDAHELTNHLLDDKKIGPLLRAQLGMLVD
ncbi:hypothetical protein N7492_010712 [Penicillium capsulatum]|uniref:Uncharacterized protein n=1 Tax=Penicillium capsulatum TaxID=69766 RepID=A0A9W9LE07_9EURO|nr:hypothetical protein N7492_010712 [Penicillium capsulatum]